MKKSNITFEKCPRWKFHISKYLIVAILYFATGFPNLGGSTGSCQNIGINTTGAAPASTNMLEVLTPATMTSDGSTGLYVSNPAAVAGGGNYGYAFQAIKTGAGVNNIAAYFSATGGTYNYALIVPPSSGIVGIGTITPNSNYLLTLQTNATILHGISLPLSGAGSTAYGINIIASSANYRGVFATNSSAAAGVFYGIGTTLTAGTAAEAYLCYRSGSPKTYAVYGKDGDYSGYFTNKVTITDNTSPDGIADLEVQNPASGSGNPATISLRPNNQITLSGNPIANLNFGSSYSTNPQAQIQVLREAASSGSTDLPAAMTFSTIADNDATITLSERMRITNGGQLGLNTTNPNRMGNASDKTISIESTNSSNLELLRITSSASSTLGTLNFDRVAAANGAITARTCIVGTTVNGTTDSRMEFHTMGTPSTLTERMRITETGTVGIGTTVPNSRLHVYHTDPAMTVGFTSQFSPNLTAVQNANLHAAWNTVRTGSSFNTNADYYGAVNRIEATASQTGTIVGAYGATNDVYNSGTGTITGAFGSANYVTNLSTGTITNAYGLQTNISNPGGGTITNGFGILISTITATNKWSLFANDATAPSYFAGNVGIGTSAPDRALHLHSASDNFHAIRLTAESTTNYWDIIKRGPSYTLPGPDNFVVAYNNNEWFQITPAGLVGIGTNSPNARLDVAGTTSTNATYGLGVRNSSAVYALVVRDDGNVGINTITPGYTLDVNGSTSTCDLYYTNYLGACSDIRYKKDINPISSALKNVLNLQGVSYFWKTSEFPDKKFSETNQLGFIAQDMEKIYPELVMTDKYGFKSVDYSRLTPILVEAIKEQQKTIDELTILASKQQTSINSLQSKISEINEALGLIGNK